ncbi:MAG: TetR/AcrR family transcriptional regulator [Planctomycetes bacterium]|nr:TetR/AcrR family transcriptional regulator [Planctomycetota bacterium]
MSPQATRKPTHVRRREIAEAALRRIGAKGSPALTAASLAEDVGLSSGALFRHFTSMDEILVAAVEYAVERIEATLPDPALPPLARLRALAGERVRVVREHPGLAWLLLSDQVWLVVPEAGVARLRQLVRRSRELILGAFTEARAAGALRADVPLEALLPVFTGTVHGLIASGGVHRGAGTPPPAQDPDAVLDTLFKLLESPTPS